MQSWSLKQLNILHFSWDYIPTEKVDHRNWLINKIENILSLNKINKISAKVTPPTPCEIPYRVFQKLSRGTFLVLSINLFGITLFSCMEINSWVKHTIITNLAQVTITMLKIRQYFYKYLAFIFCLRFYIFDFQQYIQKLYPKVVVGTHSIIPNNTK